MFEGVVHGERSLLTQDEERRASAMQVRLTRQIQQAQQEIADLESAGWKRAAKKRGPAAPSLGPTPTLVWNFSEPSSIPQGQLVGGARVEGEPWCLARQGRIFNRLLSKKISVQDS